MNGRAIVLRGDAAHLPLPDASVDLIVTSPPYFGLRSYTDGGEHYDGQIGSEATPREFLEALWACTREWVRVLKPDGSLFVNLGDKYASGNGSGNQSGLAEGGAHFNGGRRATRASGHSRQGLRFEMRASGRRDGAPMPRDRATNTTVPTKSLLGMPWRYAIGCIDDLGLILRAEIVWAKPNGLPESVTDRVRRSHEQVFHFTRQPRYYSAVDEVREAQATADRKGDRRSYAPGSASSMLNGEHQRMTGSFAGLPLNPLGKLPGSVWSIPSAPLTVPEHLGVDHFAAYPPALVRRIILGWSPAAVCTACGEGRRPVPAAVGLDMGRPQARRAHQLAERAGLTEDHFAALLSVGISDTGRGAATQTGTGKNTPEVYALAAEARSVLGGYAREYLLRRPVRFAYACACPQPDAPARPGVVLDPFSGTGTTPLVASVLGRIGIGIDRSADYCRLASWRVTDPGERARAMQVPKPPPVPEGQASLFDDWEVGA